MIRKTMMAILAVGAISLAAIGSVGYLLPVYRGFSITPRVHGYVFFSDGLLRLYGYSAAEGITLTPSAYARTVTVGRATDGAVCLRILHAYPGQVGSYALVSQAFPAPPARTTPTIHLTGVRTSVSLPVALLIAYPLVALTRSRILRHQRRVGYCAQCGYNLTGNVSGLCPECGTSVEGPLRDQESKPNG